MGKKKPTHTEYYERLGIEVDATPEQIKKAYRRAALRCHPDKPGGSEEAFQQIKEVYDVLSDPNKRKLYDRYGTEAIRVMEGGTPSPAEFLKHLKKRDRFMLVFVISFVSAMLLAFPVLIAVRWDALEKNEEPYSWSVAFIPVWILEGLVVFSVYSMFRQEPLDKNDMDLDEEAKKMWRETEWELNKRRIVFVVLFSLFLLFQIFLVLQLDGTVSFSWIVVFIPLIVFEGLILSARLFLSPYVYVQTDPSFHVPVEEEDNASPPTVSLVEVLKKSSYWFFTLYYVRWSLVRIISWIVLGLVGKYNADGDSTSFYYAAIPIFIFSGLVLLLGIVTTCQQNKNNGEQQQQQQQQHDENGENMEQPGVFGVIQGWICSYGLLLIIVCTGASKLTDITSLSAFAIFSPIFFVVGCACCACSTLALTVSAEDFEEGLAAEQRQEEEAQEQQEPINNNINITVT